MGIIRPCTYMSVEKWNVSVTEGDDVDDRASRKLSSGVCGLDYGHVVQKAGEGHHGQLWTGRCALPSIMGENTHVGLQVPYIFLERGGERQKSHGKHEAHRKDIPHVTSIASLYTWRKTCHRKTKTHATHSHIYLQHPPFIISLYTPPCPTPSKQGSRHPKLHHLVQSLIPPMLQQKPKPIYPNSTNAFASPPK